MAALQRKALEQLMDREIPLLDPRVCRSYCVDYCIFELFEGTRALGAKSCQFIHRENHRVEYRKGPKNPLFEDSFDQQIYRVLDDCEKRLRDGKLKLMLDPADAPQELIKMAQELTKEASELDLMAQEVLLLYENEMVERGKDEAKALNALREAQNQKWEKFDILWFSSIPSAHQDLQACLVCGSFLSAQDVDERLAAHFKGKLHQGYILLRETAKKRNISVPMAV